jgi:hypothetical protein
VSASELIKGLSRRIPRHIVNVFVAINAKNEAAPQNQIRRTKPVRLGTTEERVTDVSDCEGKEVGAVAAMGAVVRWMACAAGVTKLKTLNEVWIETGHSNRTTTRSQRADRSFGDIRSRQSDCAATINGTTIAACHEFRQSHVKNSAVVRGNAFISFSRFVEDVAKFSDFFGRKLFLFDEVGEHRLERAAKEPL